MTKRAKQASSPPLPILLRFYCYFINYLQFMLCPSISSPTLCRNSPLGRLNFFILSADNAKLCLKKVVYKYSAFIGRKMTWIVLYQINQKNHILHTEGCNTIALTDFLWWVRVAVDFPAKTQRTKLIFRVRSHTWMEKNNWTQKKIMTLLFNHANFSLQPKKQLEFTDLTQPKCPLITYKDQG